MMHDTSHGSLQEEVETWRTLFRRLADGVMVSDQQGKVLFSNPVAEKLFGTDAEGVSPAAWGGSLAVTSPTRLRRIHPNSCRWPALCVARMSPMR